MIRDLSATGKGDPTGLGVQQNNPLMAGSGLWCLHRVASSIREVKWWRWAESNRRPWNNLR